MQEQSPEQRIELTQMPDELYGVQKLVGELQELIKKEFPFDPAVIGRYPLN